jgi:hypothetical protein
MFGRALCDLGLYVSVIPKVVYEKLHLPERNRRDYHCALADNTCCCPKVYMAKLGDSNRPDPPMVWHGALAHGLNKAQMQHYGLLVMLG